MKRQKPKQTFKLPDSIILVGEIYKIKFVKSLPDDDWGDINFDDKIIRLNDSLKNFPVQLRYVVWHELGHYLAKIAGIEDGEVFASLFSSFINNSLNQLERANGK